MNQQASQSDGAQRAELLGWTEQSVAFAGLEPSRFSTVLLLQLQQLQLKRVVSIHAITDEIKALEGLRPTLTGAASTFKYPPLVGLWKKHFTDACFLPTNLLNFVRSKKPEDRQYRREAWDAAVAQSLDGTADEGFVNACVSAMTLTAYERKANSASLTGEWIIFQPRPTGNYYWTLASHTESNESIFQRLQLAAQFDGTPLELG